MRSDNNDSGFAIFMIVALLLLLIYAVLDLAYELDARIDHLESLHDIEAPDNGD